MTLVEFLEPLLKGTHQSRILAVLYYKERYERVDALTIDQIRQALKDARIKGWKTTNIADVLNKAGSYVDTKGLDGGKRLWGLTETGRLHVRDELDLPQADAEIEHDVTTLQSLIFKISDDDIKNYFEEALKCLQVDALRACVVFIWSGVIRNVHHQMLSQGAKKLNAALQKHDPKSRQVSKIDDFAYIKDSISLLAAVDLGLLDKTEKDTLKEALNLRNRCGHPAKYKPGVKKVSSFIEDIVSIIF